jgi:two-component system response regulator PilR (NtrC family)
MTFAKILIIDDEDMFREDLATILSKQGYDCTTAPDAKTGLQKVQELLPDIVLSDIFMPGLSSLDVLEDILKINPDCSVIIMTAFGSLDTAIDAFRKGAVDYILKPIVLEDLERKLIRIIENKHLMREIRYLRQEISNEVGTFPLLGKSQAMKSVLELIEKVAPTRSNVLIKGETGTGKELVARAVHHFGVTKDRPFVALNCSGLQESLLESELFGHKKGAFTGADRNKAGFFEVANDGTIFLDEISEMPVALQSKLLRVLEEREYYPVGSTVSLPMKARIITATNKNLKELIQDGQFREDLFFRISVFEIEIPPLRDRRSDIPLLADHFVRKYNKEMNRQILGITSECVRVLMMYDWPGNVRELRNIIERAMILCEDQYIGLEHIPPQITGQSLPKVEIDNLRAATRSFERAHIIQVLTDCHWNKEEAARRLDINPSTLYRKLAELEIVND